MHDTTPAGLLAVATAAAEAAGESALRWFGRGPAADTKADGTVVTVADREAEHVLRDHILSAFPGHSILGEEHGETRGTAPWRWILDPIDGTEAFVRAVPLWSVLVAVEHEGEIVCGVAAFPALRETYAAARGLGSTWNGRPCRVSQTPDLASACLLTTSERNSRRRLPGWPRLVERVRRIRGWSDAYALAMVASGRADVCVEPVMQSWDNAPFLVLLEEAGGRFTDLSGRRTVHGGSAVATNGLLHDATLAALAEA